MVTQQLERATRAIKARAGGHGEETIIVRPSAVAKVAGMTVREMDGVTLGTMRGFMASIVGAGPGLSQEIRRAVRARVTDSGHAAVDICINIEYGRNVPDVVADVRARIEERVHRMTGLDTSRINIEVTDILLPGDQPQPVA